MTNKIILKNLLFSGVHGYTEKEKVKPQRFILNITHKK